MSEEGEDFLRAFGAQFAAPPISRQALDRRACLTSKQRAARKPSDQLKTDTLNLRVSPKFKLLLKSVADKLGCSMSDAVETAMADLATKLGI